jgi:PEP-CTERM motif
MQTKRHSIMKIQVRLIRSLLLGLLSLGAVAKANADTTVSVNPDAGWIGFMNVFDVPSDGGGYEFGNGWATADLTATFSDSVLTLGPNTIGDPDPFWYIGGGGPGAPGYKIMDASMYVEPAGSLPGQTVTFSGTVLANTLVGQVDLLGNGWTSVAFIKDFAMDYSSSNSITVPLTVGAFSISLATVNDPMRHVQYGFETVGPDVWITDVGQFGNIQIATVPEPSALALLGIGAFSLLALYKQRCQERMART